MYNKQVEELKKVIKNNLVPMEHDFATILDIFYEETYEEAYAQGYEEGYEQARRDFKDKEYPTIADAFTEEEDIDDSEFVTNIKANLIVSSDGKPPKITNMDEKGR